MKLSKTLFIVLAINALLLLSASASFADTTNYYYDDWNRIIRVEKGQPGSQQTGASITVLSPAGGEAWTLANTHKIEWSYTGNPGTIRNFNGFRQGSL